VILPQELGTLRRSVKDDLRIVLLDRLRSQQPVRHVTLANVNDPADVQATLTE
jgi:hypothetical protein